MNACKIHSRERELVEIVAISISMFTNLIIISKWIQHKKLWLQAPSRVLRTNVHIKSYLIFFACSNTDEVKWLNL